MVVTGFEERLRSISRLDGTRKSHARTQPFARTRAVGEAGSYRRRAPSADTTAPVIGGPMTSPM